MKKVTSTLFCIIFVYTAFSQSLTLSNGQGPVPNNSDITIVGGVDPLECYITVNNTSSANKNVECKKMVLQNVFGSMNYFCWGLCYPPNTNVGISPVMIPAGTSNSTNFSGHYDCQGNAGTAIVRYIFWVVGNAMDSVCFNVHYTGCTVGIEEVELSSGLSEPYPNPAGDLVSVRYAAKSGSHCVLELVNVQGSLVNRIVLDPGSASTAISVDGLSKGLYFLRLSENGMVISQKKLMVE